MRNINSVLALLVITFMVSCSSDDDGSGGNNYDFDYFEGIEVGGNVNVILNYGSNQNVDVYGDGDLNAIDLYVDNDILYMSADNGDVSNVEIVIESPNIKGIVVKNNGVLDFGNAFSTAFDELYIEGFDAAEIYNDFPLDVSTLDVYLENAAKLAITDLEADEAYVDLHDGSRCTLEGFATDQFITLDNGTRLNLDFPYNDWEAQNPLQGDNCTITTDNGGNGWVQASNVLTATADNGTRIYYQGEPTTTNFTELNGGEIVQKDNL